MRVIREVSALGHRGQSNQRPRGQQASKKGSMVKEDETAGTRERSRDKFAVGTPKFLEFK